MQERRNSIADALELRFPCTNPSIGQLHRDYSEQRIGWWTKEKAVGTRLEFIVVVSGSKRYILTNLRKLKDPLSFFDSEIRKKTCMKTVAENMSNFGFRGVPANATTQIDCGAFGYTVKTKFNSNVSKEVLLRCQHLVKAWLKIAIHDWLPSLTCQPVSHKVSCWRNQMEIFSQYWLFVRGIHRLPVNSPLKDQWRGALMFSLICAWSNGWVNIRDAGDLKRHRAHYDVTVMCSVLQITSQNPVIWHQNTASWNCIIMRRLYPTGSDWSMDQGSTKKSFAVYNCVPRVTNYCDKTVDRR